MQISLNTIFDLVINTLKNCFLIDRESIKEIKSFNEWIQLIVVDEEEENRKFRIRLHYGRNGNECEVSYATLVILDRCSDEIQHITTTFTSHGLLQFEESMRCTLGGSKFFEEELSNL